MSLEFYFLRSSEQKIVVDMLRYSQGLDASDVKVEDVETLKKYYEFYGLTPKDFGVYALKDGVVAGAIWSRRLSEYHKSKGYLVDDTPVLQITVKPEFRSKGIGRALMEQYLSEAASLYELITISTPRSSVAFLEKFGFEVVKESEHLSYVGETTSLIMQKKLQKQESKKHFTDFSSCKWMD